MTDADHIRTEAIGWLIRLRDGDVADWEAFTAWLEASPRRAEIYNAVALADSDLDFSHPAGVRHAPANDDALDTPWSSRFGRRFLAAGAVAAVLVAGVAVYDRHPRADRYQIATGAGEHRTFALGEGTRIDLNGSSRITLDRNDVRTAALEQGEALFSVRHDAAHPFVATVGDSRVEDVGTVFDIVRRPAGISVEVAEGGVTYNPGGQEVALHEGQTLQDAGPGQPIAVGSKAPAEMGSWREGRLTFRDATLSHVADDLARNIGEEVAVDPAVASRQFTGVIQVERNRKTLFARLASVLGLDARRTAKGWKISMRGRAAQ